MSLKKIYDTLSMSGYALLSEAYGDLKPKKRGKNKKNKVYNAQGFGREQSQNTIQPLSPSVMNSSSELLSQNSPNPYDSVTTTYRSVHGSEQAGQGQPIDTLMENKHIMRIDDYSQQLQGLRSYKVEDDPSNPMRMNTSSQASANKAPATKSPAMVQDPEYLEFLEYKRRKGATSHDLMTHSDQFNELLLYIFTGFLLLSLYDHIYKLGRDTTFF